MKTVNYLLIILSVCLCTLSSAYAQHQDDIVDRLNMALGVALPTEYEQIIKDFAANDTIMKTRSATAYTEEFIKEQMKADWGISKQNQLLFIWSEIYEGISKKTLYDWLDDEDEARSNEFYESIHMVNESNENYRKGFKTYMEAKSAEYDRQSAEYDRQSAEYDRQSAEARQQSAEYDRQSAEAVKNIMSQDSAWVKEHMPEFYDIYTTNPAVIKEKDLAFMKQSTQEFIADCKKRGIDYRAILMKELGDKKKVEEMLKFYGVE